MFDIAWSELLVIAVIALVVIGPKDLPKAIFALGKWVRKARGVAREFQTHIDDMMRETELDELRKEALKTRDLNIKKMMEDTIDPKGEVGKAFDPKAFDPKAFDVGLTGHAGSTPEPEPDLPQALALAPTPAAPAPAPAPQAEVAPPAVTDSAPPSAAPSPITIEPPQPAAAVSAQPTDKQT